MLYSHAIITTIEADAFVRKIISIMIDEFKRKMLDRKAMGTIIANETAQAVSSNRPKICPECGTPTGSSGRFCTNCGTRRG